MQITHRILLSSLPATLTATGLLATPAAAQTIDMSVTIPRQSVAEYHAPYVAIWLEKAGAPARTLSVWYDFDKRNGEGTKWLRDIRQWWRASGRALKFPADGITGATRAPGTHKLAFTAGRGSLGALAGGDYVMVIEAAREVGGRELVRLPFSWPPKPGQTVRVAGKAELGAIALTFRK